MKGGFAMKRNFFLSILLFGFLLTSACGFDNGPSPSTKTFELNEELSEALLTEHTHATGKVTLDYLDRMIHVHVSGFEEEEEVMEEAMVIKSQEEEHAVAHEAIAVMLDGDEVHLGELEFEGGETEAEFEFEEDMTEIASILVVEEMEGEEFTILQAVIQSGEGEEASEEEGGDHAH